MKILSSASARPNFIKLAAVHHALAARQGMTHAVVHTGQHYDALFSDVFFHELHIPSPVANLGVHGGERSEVIEATERAMIPVLEDQKPDIVLVYGDVSGAVGAARAAKSLGLHLGHIEAGLRSYDSTMPEELNRMEIDRLSDDLFVTESSGAENLATEQLEGTVHVVGNTMIDTLIRMQPSIERATVDAVVPERFGIATLHRPSNVDSSEALRSALMFLAQVSLHCPLILPLHHRTKKAIADFGLSHLLPSTVIISEPLGYLSFLHLLTRSAFIITDSGGVQEEATFLRKRCFTLRRNTERPSTIASGSNVLVDERHASDVDLVCQFAAHPVDPAVVIPPLWDGKAGERIIETYFS